MSTYIIGCDLNNPSTDAKSLQILKSKLENKGHTVEVCGVGPGNLQSACRKSSANGKIAIFLVNGADLQTYKDFYIGIKNGYYHVKYCWFGLQGWLNKKTCTCEAAKTVKLQKAHDDASSVKFTADIVGLTTAEVMKKYNEYINYCCGDSIEELAERLANGGEDDDEESSATTIKDAIKEVLSGWDGDVECFVRGDVMTIRKIQEPSLNCELSLIEGYNVIYDSVTVSDVNPETVNFLTVHWEGGSDIVLRDENLIDRFGEKPLEMDAVKTVVTTETVESDNNNSSSGGDSTSDDSSSKTKTVSNEVAITDYEEALSFANREWAKIKRENGHQIECQVLGHSDWKQGLWVYVNLPSFEEDCYMYITKVSQNESDGDWDCNLTLVDYPPSLGEPTEEDDEEDVDASTEEDTTTTTTT